MAHQPKSKVVAVVVAYNRAKLLNEVLTALSNQSYKLHKVIVVDNASTDNTSKTAKKHKVKVLSLKENTGGAGGFFYGLKYAYDNYKADYYWLMDDDCIPKKRALSELIVATKKYNKEELAICSSKVLWTNGKEHHMNKARKKPFCSKREEERAEKIGALPIRTASFVSFLISNRAVKRYGFPLKNYFIWNDDFEYSSRILKKEKGIFVPSSVVLHKTEYFGDTTADPGKKFYFEVRNKIWVFFKTKNFYFHEWVCYFFASVARWIKTIIKSKNKKLLIKMFCRGLKDGISKNPTTSDLGHQHLKL